MAYGNNEVWLAMILCDASFPGGALANSQGLESAVAHGMVKRGDPDSFYSFILMSMEQTLLQYLPYVRTAHHMISSKLLSFNEKRNKLSELDSYCHAMLSNEISRRASCSQGKCLLRVITESCPTISDQLLHIYKFKELEQRVHYAPIFGTVCSLLGISMSLCDRLFIKVILRDLISAAVRLNVLGPIEGTSIQTSFQNNCDIIKRLDIGDVTEHVDTDCISISSIFYKGIVPVQPAPILDLLQARHDLLYTRLFNS